MSKKDIYFFPAIFDYADDGISISFPDLPGALTCGDTEEEALKMAKECLGLHLFGMEQDKESIPKASEIKNTKHEENQAVVMIRVNMKLVRGDMQNKAVKKTLTIPKWLNDTAVERKLNFSAILKNALMEELEIEQ